MKKKLVIMAAVAALASVNVYNPIQVAQATASKQAVSSNFQSFDNIGIKLPIQGSWKMFDKDVDKKTIVDESEDGISGLVVNLKCEGLPEKKQKATYFREIFAIAEVKTGKVKEDTVHEMVGGPNKEGKMEKIAQSNGMTYYFITFNYDETGLNDADKAKYKKLYAELANLKKNIKTFKPVRVENAKSLSFTTKDLNGKKVTNDIFKKSKLTLVNIWGTFCGPCIRELPDLQALSQELKGKGVNFIGIVGDVGDANGKIDEDTLQLAKNIVATKKVKYTNVSFSKELAKQLPVSAFPTTLIVDSKGNVVVKAFIGSKTKAEYKKIILDALAKAK